jgi:hypothetical protein
VATTWGDAYEHAIRQSKLPMLMDMYMVDATSLVLSFVREYKDANATR